MLQNGRLQAPKIQGYFLGRFHQTPNVQVRDGHDDTFGESLFTIVISRLHVGHVGACLLRAPLCRKKFFALSVVAICSYQLTQLHGDAKCLKSKHCNAAQMNVQRPLWLLWVGKSRSVSLLLRSGAVAYGTSFTWFGVTRQKHDGTQFYVIVPSLPASSAPDNKIAFFSWNNDQAERLLTYKLVVAIQRVASFPPQRKTTSLSVSRVMRWRPVLKPTMKEIALRAMA